MRTADGFEANIAVGYLSRALLSWLLADMLRATKGAQALTVVGLNLTRIDFEEPSAPEGFSSMKALGHWQWAMQVFAREWKVCESVPMNVFMPGLVKTKILANEPMPMRLVIPIVLLLMGVPVEKAGGEVVERISREAIRDGNFARTALKPRRNLRTRKGTRRDCGNRRSAGWLAGSACPR